jgi:hypothetical protein
VNVADKLLEEFVVGEGAEGDEIISGRRLLTADECEELKSHCTLKFECASNPGISWSFPCDDSHQNLHDALLAVGNASGRVSIWR